MTEEKEKTLNVIVGYHFKKENDCLVFNDKKYKWYIPKYLREKNIRQGDMVLVEAKNKKEVVLVGEVLREEVKDKGRPYKLVIDVVEQR